MTTTMKNSSVELAIKDTGKQTILGTDWSVSAKITRDAYLGRTTWTVTWGICNGTASGSRTFKTRREAMAFYESR